MKANSGKLAKDAVRAQYGAVGDAYVKSIGHATGADLERMVAVAHPASTDEMLDIATGGGHGRGSSRRMLPQLSPLT